MDSNEVSNFRFSVSGGSSLSQARKNSIKTIKYHPENPIDVLVFRVILDLTSTGNGQVIQKYKLLFRNLQSLCIFQDGSSVSFAGTVSKFFGVLIRMF